MKKQKKQNLSETKRTLKRKAYTDNNSKHAKMSEQLAKLNLQYFSALTMTSASLTIACAIASNNSEGKMASFFAICTAILGFGTLAGMYAIGSAYRSLVARYTPKPDGVRVAHEKANSMDTVESEGNQFHHIFWPALSIIAIVVLMFVTWPHLELQVRVSDGGSQLRTVHPGESTMTAFVWNDGGDVANWQIITPNNCISANLNDSNITCTQPSALGVIRCDERRVCGKSPPGEQSPDRPLKLTYRDPHNKPASFQINVTSYSNLGPIPLTTMHVRLNCVLNGSTMYDVYKCLPDND